MALKTEVSKLVQRGISSSKLVIFFMMFQSVKERFSSDEKSIF